MDTGNIDTTAAVAALATVSAITSSGGTTLTTAMEQQAINLATGYLCSKKAEPGKKAAQPPRPPILVTTIRRQRTSSHSLQCMGPVCVSYLAAAALSLGDTGSLSSSEAADLGTSTVQAMSALVDRGVLTSATCRTSRPHDAIDGALQVRVVVA